MVVNRDVDSRAVGRSRGGLVVLVGNSVERGNLNWPVEGCEMMVSGEAGHCFGLLLGGFSTPLGFPASVFSVVSPEKVPHVTDIQRALRPSVCVGRTNVQATPLEIYGYAYDAMGSLWKFFCLNEIAALEMYCTLTKVYSNQVLISVGNRSQRYHFFERWPVHL